MREKAEKYGFPMVIKPVDGVSCDGINLILDTRSLQLALDNRRFCGNRFLPQRYIEGDHASVCLLVAGNKILCLSLNKQLIEVGTPFSYQEGRLSRKGI